MRKIVVFIIMFLNLWRLLAIVIVLYIGMHLHMYVYSRKNILGC